MASYYVNNNAQANGDHEVHISTCYYYPRIVDKTYLGEFTHCRDAVTKAKQYHKQSNGCAFCCPACHTS